MELIRSHLGRRDTSLKNCSGFTLIELLVVLAIITIVTAVVLTSQSAFNKTLVLSNTAYDVALTIRYAETFGTGSRAVGATPNPGYGVDFSNGSNTSFLLFPDTSPAVGTGGSACHPAPSYDPTGPSALPGDCVYKKGSDGDPQVYTLGNGVTIDNFCANQSISGWKCEKANGLKSLDIVFSRPNPTPFMSEDGSYQVLPDSITTACIALISSQGTYKYVSISASGQVSANAISCPTPPPP